MQPVLAVVFGIVILSEAPSRAQLAGVALLIAGVLPGSAVRRRPGAIPADRVGHHARERHRLG
jgi:threonine/homoserine efflux transporter RhtA